MYPKLYLVKTKPFANLRFTKGYQFLSVLTGGYGHLLLKTFVDR